LCFHCLTVYVSLFLAAGFAGLISRLGWFGFSLSNPASGYTLPPQAKGQAVAAALRKAKSYFFAALGYAFGVAPMTPLELPK
jgi:hypothetical protein